MGNKNSVIEFDVNVLLEHDKNIVNETSLHVNKKVPTMLKWTWVMINLLKGHLKSQ